jgi:hypothetical protein
MKVDAVSFGTIVIDGMRYDKDLCIVDGSIVLRETKDTHIVDRDELEKLVNSDSKVVIIGTGQSGNVEITDEALEFLKEKKIGLIEELTPEAVKIFNSKDKKGVVAIFHLTC